MDNPYTCFFKSLLGASALALAATVAFSLLILMCAAVGVVILAVMLFCLPFVPFIVFGVAAYEVGMTNTFLKGLQ